MKMNKEAKELAAETAKQTVFELMKNNMMKSDKRSPFQKTEILLYNYNNFLDVIKNREEQIEELKQNGLRKHSISVLPAMNTVHDNYVKTEQEKIDEKIAEIQINITTTKNFISIIDKELDCLKNEKYFDIIRMKYFEGKTHEEIAEHFHCDVKTISRQKNNLINKLQIKLFSDESIKHILLS